MPVFIYKAKQDNAQTVSGEVTARDAEEAVDLVGQLGLLPVSVEEKGTASSGVVLVSRIKPRLLRRLAVFAVQCASELVLAQFEQRCVFVEQLDQISQLRRCQRGNRGDIHFIKRGGMEIANIH